MPAPRRAQTQATPPPQRPSASRGCCAKRDFERNSWTALTPAMMGVGTDPSPTIMANTRPAAVTRCLLTILSGNGWSVRGKPGRAGLGVDLGGHHALGTGPEPDQHILAGTKLRYVGWGQGLHVDKYIRRPLPAGQEPESA